MIDQLTTVTSSVVSLSLDALSQRQQLIAANLANASSGTSAADVRFEDALRQLVNDATASADEQLAALNDLKQRIREGELRAQDNGLPVQLDKELVRLNETVIRYQALVEGLGKYGSLMSMAVSGEVKR